MLHGLGITVWGLRFKVLGRGFRGMKRFTIPLEPPPLNNLVISGLLPFPPSIHMKPKLEYFQK